MIQVETDKPGNLVKVSYLSHVDVEQARQAVDRFVTLLNDVSPGFRMLTDLSGLDSMDTGCAKYIRKVMDLCNQKGISLVVRVIPDPAKDIGLNILSVFHYRRGVRIVTCETMDEALRALKDN